MGYLTMFLPCPRCSSPKVNWSTSSRDLDILTQCVQCEECGLSTFHVKTIAFMKLNNVDFNTTLMKYNDWVRSNPEQYHETLWGSMCTYKCIYDGMYAKVRLPKYEFESTADRFNIKEPSSMLYLNANMEAIVWLDDLSVDSYSSGKKADWFKVVLKGGEYDITLPPAITC